MKLLIMQSSPASRLFTLSRPNILHSTLFSHTLRWAGVSHPYKTTGKIMVFIL
jgi:hypothetical protein